MSFASRMIQAESLGVEFRVTLRTIEKDSPSARMQGKSACCRSGVCCWRRPGELTLEDVSRLATHLDLSEKELFQQYLVVDQFHGKMVLRLRRAHEESGRMLDWRDTYSIASPCVFLRVDEGNACAVHEAKPQNCRDYKCWENSPAIFTDIPEAKLRELGWDGVDPDDVDDGED